MTDIKALVAGARGHEPALLGRAGGKESDLYYAAELIHRLATALENRQDVVVAARMVLNNPGSWMGLMVLRTAIKAHDAPPERGTRHD